jgi:hypothetical protein
VFQIHDAALKGRVSRRSPLGAAQAIRQLTGAARFKIYDAGREASLAALRDGLGAKDFECSWVEGAALSTEDAIAYA